MGGPGANAPQPYLCLESMTAERWEPLPPTEAHQGTSSGPGDGGVLPSHPLPPETDSSWGWEPTVHRSHPDCADADKSQKRINRLCDRRIQTWSSEAQMGLGHGRRQDCCDCEQECRPRWGWGLGAGGRRCTERLQEGCSSGSQRGLVADVPRRRSLVPRRRYSANESYSLITRSLVPLVPHSAPTPAALPRLSIKPQRQLHGDPSPLVALGFSFCTS